MNLTQQYWSLIRSKAGLVAVLSLASVVIGFAAWFLKWLIASAHDLIHRTFVHGWIGNIVLIITAVATILLVGLYVRKVVRMPLEHATEQLQARLKEGRGVMPLRLTISSLFATALTLGGGGSAGAEGPIAFTGGAIGSNIARLFRLPPQTMLISMACGSGAGIAAIFKSPIGGMFFTIEVLRMQLGVKAVIMLGVMCLISSLTTLALSGFTPDLAVRAGLSFEWDMVVPAIVLGIACGIYSAYYVYTGSITDRRLERIRRPVVRNIASGLTLGVLLAAFPALYGEGYGILNDLAAGNPDVAGENSVLWWMHSRWMPAFAMGGILLAKGIACMATNSGGGVAGTFTPTLFAGAVLGALFAFLWPGSMSPDIAMVCGMAGAMGGIIRAPLMSVFLVVEMTRCNSLLMPVCIVVALSFTVSSLFLRDKQ